MQVLTRLWAVVPILVLLVGLAADRPVQARPPSRDLQTAVDALAHWVAESHGQLGLAVLDVGSGQEMAAVHETAAQNPASNAKLLTAAVALKRLGPDYRYTTSVHGRVRDGVALDLILRGHGDPSLRTEDLAEMCRELVALGLRRVDGSILVDQGRFDEQYVPPAFDQQPDEWGAFRAPVSAVALERNTVTLNVVAAQARQPARVWFDPPGGLLVSGRVETSDPGSGQHVRWSLRAEGARLRATLDGQLAEGLPRLQVSRRMDDPRLMPGFALKALLESGGVAVHGDVALGGTGVRQPLVSHRSAPLSVLVAELGKESDNFYAEMLLKTLGAEASGKAASSRDGADVVTAWLREVGALDAGTVVVNGSGLFDANRTSPLALARALRAAYLDPAIRPEFLAQLAVGGADGTLRSRFRAYRGRRAIRAKTGTLAKVDALSGYVLPPDARPPLAFSIIVVGIADHGQVRRRVDAVVAELARVSAD
jgi:serine-type D-Ala-D-Ala carboxypeptidase/endopeptidase (penicillin-binding protein 4)